MADARFRWGAWLSAMGLALVAAPAAAQQPAAPVTFTKDIAPIFQKCESCHRPDSIAPMSLVTYEEARPWARSIKTRVAARQMPPWHIDKNVGIQHFKNDRSLSDAQIDTIVRWVDAGAPKGELKDMPPPVKWPDEQRSGTSRSIFGEPRSRSSSRRPTRRSAHGAGRVVQAGRADRPHRGALGARDRDASRHGQGPQDHAPRARPPAAERRRRRRAAASAARRRRPGPRPLHGMGRRQAGRDHARRTRGKLMLPGSKIVWDIHYHAVGEEITDSRRARHLLLPEGPGAEVPPGAGALQRHHRRQPQPRHPAQLGLAWHQNFHVMRKAGRVENFQPHMHLRGKAMSMEAILPDRHRRRC